ncbi:MULTISPECIES: limonene-1,2-epoxide hydrolase family protein [unclassified Mycobacterium]|uniref:nuclear transport factor 2 family protein n=1 Tax=unclassified Mycobacterium TaxID=2642494 RepID=UPI00074A89F1|nr:MULTISPECIES: limonene-1,2-epoxide hydrolase family protein [unclassified Mycobacterium]KUH89956.1 hypothetical protein AU185_07380 [Mycobacterium sp. GA-0227b]
MGESAESVVRGFLAAWPRWSVDELTGYFTEDAVWTDGHSEPYSGIAAIETQLQKIGQLVPSTTVEITNLLSSRRIVMVERTDIFDFKGCAFNVEVTGVLEVNGDGRITRWRDYYDSRLLESRVTELLSQP